MADARRCPRCGTALPAGGECTRCLLALGLTEGLTPAAAAPSPTEPGLEGPERVGPYRILDTLASEGTRIYLAEEEPSRRRVALKIAPPGISAGDAWRRFEAERPALALMDHPGIARVLDAGTTDDGRRWLATEWVAGVPITEYCDRERLTPRQRLLLFVEVCGAIQHAHTRGVLHRDLKPSNVLVSETGGRPRPRVVDLGVGGALGPKLSEQMLYSAAGVLAGTPGYMSPEQAESPPEALDARSDVYSLGALLYELMVGEPPFDPRQLRKAGWDGMVRIIRERVPPRPSARITTLAGGSAPEVALRRRTDPGRLARHLRGDLDAIVLRALAKEKRQRYESVEALAADVERNLRGEPVTAGPRWPWEWLVSALRDFGAWAGRWS